MRRMLPALLLCLPLLSCGEGPATPAPEPAPPAETPAASALLPLDPPRLARRLSLDLRGVLPTLEELDAVAADPAALETLREQWLADPRFETQMVRLYQERWLTSIDAYRVFFTDHRLEVNQEYDFLRTVGEEPLRLIARVLAADLPYTEIVTADWTMSNDLALEMWLVEEIEAGGEGWRPARYTDGRPAAGVLSTNGMWIRYISPTFNYNRGRTATLIKLLACDDFLERPVSVSGNVSLTAGAADEAIRTNPTCIACHAAMEPVAATLFGFIALADQNHLEMERYHVERENLGPATLQVEPAWFGTPVDGLEDLGRAIALDPRFAACAVETLSEGLLRRQTTVEDFDLLTGARADFLRDELRGKAVVRAITRSAAYQAGALTAEASPAEIEGATTARLLLASHLRSLLADLGGFTWITGGWDMLDNDLFGYRVLGGAVDGELLTEPQRFPGLTWTLTQTRVAEVAGPHLAVQALAGDGRLLPALSEDLRPGDAQFRALLGRAHWGLLAVAATDEELDELEAHWSAVFGLTSSLDAAWGSVLTVVMLDPRFLTY
jgi:hypothetical protein